MFYRSSLAKVGILILLSIFSLSAQGGSSNSPTTEDRDTLVGQNSSQQDQEFQGDTSNIQEEIPTTFEWLKDTNFESLNGITRKFIRVDGHIITLYVHSQSNYVKIKILSSPQARDAKKKFKATPCLIYDFTPKAKSGYVGHIASNPDCQGNLGGLPVTGNNILRIVDQISAELEISEYDLIDESEIECNGQPISISLKWLHLFEKGTTWYESKGYLPKDYYSEYRSSVEFLRRIPMKEILDALEANSIFNPSSSLVYDRKMGIHPDLRKFLKNFENESSLSHEVDLNKIVTLNLVGNEFYKDHPNGTLSEFVITLWKQNQCLELKESLDALKWTPIQSLMEFIDLNSKHLLKTTSGR